ncbi:MAG TPA: two-component regulator propeller domain-containing protein, partial [Bacteroidota bacterium]|nr:two-component regulator propeller domain-containing protein [Bacteroidota bacterium]
MSAQMQEIHFKHLSINEGLSYNWVHCFLQDQYGFMWIGTDDGLNRYDGTAFKIYRKDPTNKQSLVSSCITTLFEDSQNRLWVGTYNGLALYDRQKDCFISQPDWPAFGITSIVEDEHHILWIGTTYYIYTIDISGTNILSFHPNLFKPKIGSISSGIVFKI